MSPFFPHPTQIHTDTPKAPTCKLTLNSKALFLLAVEKETKGLKDLCGDLVYLPSSASTNTNGIFPSVQNLCATATCTCTLGTMYMYPCIYGKRGTMKRGRWPAPKLRLLFINPVNLQVEASPSHCFFWEVGRIGRDMTYKSKMLSTLVGLLLLYIHMLIF